LKEPPPPGIPSGGINPEAVQMTNEDYITPEQRLNPERPDIIEVMAATRSRLQARLDCAREQLRARGRLLIDPACAWRPTSAAQTDVAATMQAERERLAKGARKARRIGGRPE
jgi:hypothetical protein